MNKLKVRIFLDLGSAEYPLKAQLFDPETGFYYSQEVSFRDRRQVLCWFNGLATGWRLAGLLVVRLTRVGVWTDRGQDEFAVPFEFDLVPDVDIPEDLLAA